MSGADDIRAALAKRTDDAWQSVLVAFGHASVPHTTYIQSLEMLAFMQACPAMILSLEALQDAAKQAEASIRQALAVAMAESGATTVLSTGHSTSLRDSARVVRVTDERLVPSEFMRRPEPVPDKVAIARELRAGRAVQGCELSNGGPATISIRSRT